MGDLEEGAVAPLFTLSETEGDILSLDQFLGKWVVLYFYPKDNTPGCSVQAKDFTASNEKIKQKNAVVLGVSPDDCKSHAKFVKKFGINYLLLSDPGGEVAQQYGVWGLKKFMGREYMGVTRSTFLIDPEGRIKKIWVNVKPEGHIDEVLRELEETDKT